MNELQHYGILGMKWGIRRRRSSGPDTSSDDHKVSRSIKAKKISEMSNEELKKLTTRLQLERQLKDLSAKDVSSGQKFVADVLSAHAKITAAALLALGTKTLVTVVKERFGRG
jgi:hypothetical protein